MSMGRTDIRGANAAVTLPLPWLPLPPSAHLVTRIQRRPTVSQRAGRHSTLNWPFSQRSKLSISTEALHVTPTRPILHKEPRGWRTELSLNSLVKFLISVTQFPHHKRQLMDTEDLTIHLKIIITSIATHYRPFFFFFWGSENRWEEKGCVCVCNSLPFPPLKLKAKRALTEHPPPHSFSDFPCVWQPWQFWEILVRNFVDSPLIEIWWEGSSHAQLTFREWGVRVHLLEGRVST